jgi:hypothetical protein
MAPRPIVGELISSWLSRVAAANCISLDELLDALSLVNRWGRCPSECLDVNLDLVMQLALSNFCRVPPELVSQLSLVRQLPGVPKKMFLSSPNFFSVSGCPTTCRVGYAFCPDCLQEAARMGHPAYIPAVWSLALLTHCRVHLRPLQSRCPVCLVEEPLATGSHWLRTRDIKQAPARPVPGRTFSAAGFWKPTVCHFPRYLRRSFPRYLMYATVRKGCFRNAEIGLALIE